MKFFDRMRRIRLTPKTASNILGGCALLVQSPANLSDVGCGVGQFFSAISGENTSCSAASFGVTQRSNRTSPALESRAGDARDPQEIRAVAPRRITKSAISL